MHTDSFLLKLKTDVAIFYNTVIYLKNNKTLNQVYFGSFPVGACGNISDILGLYLSELRYENIKYLSSDSHSDPEVYTHAWLEVENYTVDITAYQFKEILTEILISETSVFHGKFDLVKTSNFSDRIKYIPIEILDEYSKIKKYLKLSS